MLGQEFGRTLQNFVISLADIALLFGHQLLDAIHDR
jgi:hypothetical protein